MRLIYAILAPNTKPNLRELKLEDRTDMPTGVTVTYFAGLGHICLIKIFDMHVLSFRYALCVFFCFFLFLFSFSGCFLHRKRLVWTNFVITFLLVPVCRKIILTEE